MTADPTLHKGYSGPYDDMLGELFAVMALVLPSHTAHGGALLSWGWLNTCLHMGWSEQIPCFALLACSAFAFPIKPSLSQPKSFLTFTLSIYPLLIPPGREVHERLCGA